MSAKKVCEACEESGSPICLRKAFQGQGQVLVPERGEALWKCTHIESIPDQGGPPYVAGEVPQGFRHLLEESFLPEDEQVLKGGADNLPLPDDVPDEEGV